MATGLVYIVNPDNFISLSIVISILTYPYFIFIIYATYKDQFIGYYQLMAATANGMAGVLVVYVCHYFPYSEFYIFIGLLLMVFFAYYMLHLRLINSVITSLIYFITFQVYLLTISDLNMPNVAALSICLWFTGIASFFGGYVAELTNRRIFLQQKTILKQQKALKEKNNTLISIEENLKQYLPVQVVNTIKSGHKDATFETERRKLTIFFSDIKDFTCITDAMEPEDMASLLDEYLSEMDVIINKYNGTLAQVTGDSLLVFFGAPEQTNDKDHALRCLSMAVSMQERMKALQRKWFNSGIDDILTIRCGINTGMATVGNFGSTSRKLYTAHGMQVNIAARLEQTCEPGGILISHATWALVNDDIQCTEQGQIDVKGYHKPVRVYSIKAN